MTQPFHRAMLLAWLLLSGCGVPPESDASLRLYSKYPVANAIQENMFKILKVWGAPASNESPSSLNPSTLNPQPTSMSNTAEIRELKQYQYYTGGFDCDLRGSRWIFHLLDSNFLVTTGNDDNWRGFSFVTDNHLPLTCRNYSDDFTNSGFDRGHLAPAKDFDGYGDGAVKESFFTTNIEPQVGNGFNRHLWYNLERATRYWAKTLDFTVVYTGPIYYSDKMNPPRYIGTRNRIRVPDAFFKIVVDAADADQPSAIAFIMKNVDHREIDYPNSKLNPKCMDKPSKKCERDNLTNIARHQTTIAEIETLTNLKFFPDLDAPTAKSLKNTKPSLWKMDLTGIKFAE